jgi:hypothetical protein
VKYKPKLIDELFMAAESYVVAMIREAHNKPDWSLPIDPHTEATVKCRQRLIKLIENLEWEVAEQ